MRARTPLGLRCVILFAALAASALSCAEPFGYAINSRGNFEDNSRVFALWRVDLSTGAEDYVGWAGRGEYIDIEGIAFDPDGRLYGADDSTHTLVRIGTETGNAVPVGGLARNMGIPTGTSMDFGMTFTCRGDLLVSSAGKQELYRGDPETGQLTLIGGLEVPIVDMATIGDTVYGIGLGTDGDGSSLAPNLYVIDPEVPGVELIGALGSQASPYIQAGLAADESGRLWAITDRNAIPPSIDALPSEILQIDPVTGKATRVAETIVGIESLAIAPPGDCDRGGPAEPSSIPVLSAPAMWTLGLLVLVLAAAPIRRLGAN